MDRAVMENLAKLSKLHFTEAELDETGNNMTDLITLMSKVCDYEGDTDINSSNRALLGELRSDKHARSSHTDVKSYTVPKIL